MGSVSRHAVSHSPVPVIVVRYVIPPIFNPCHADLADPNEKSRSHSINDKPTPNEVNTPRYSVQRVYHSVGPGLEGVWAEATRFTRFNLVLDMDRHQTQLYTAIPRFTLLYVEMHQYSLVCALLLLECPVHDLISV